LREKSAKYKTSFCGIYDLWTRGRGGFVALRPETQTTTAHNYDKP